MNKKEIEKLYAMKKEADEIIRLIKEFEAKPEHKFNKTQFGNKRFYEGIRRACEILSQ